MILKRLKEYIDYKGISISMFERTIGMSNASFGKSLKSGGSIGCDKLENILRIYPDLNEMWLLKGDGQMIKDDDNKIISEPQHQYKSSAFNECQLCKEKERLINMLESQLANSIKEIDRLHIIISDLSQQASASDSRKRNSA